MGGDGNAKGMHWREADARVRIDIQLHRKGWRAEQVEREGVRHDDERRALKGLRPDYVLYAGDGTRRSPIAVLEAKGRHHGQKRTSMAQALQDSETYARRLGCPIALASDGVLFKTRHLSDGHALQINGEELHEIPSEKVLLRFLNSSTWTRGEVVRGTNELVSIFTAAFRILRKEGLENIEAFSEFSQILFVKILSEIDDDRIRAASRFHWREMENLAGERLLRTYKNGLELLNQSYEGVFGATKIEKPQTLETIVARLHRYSFIDVDADVKGEAYEYFLRRYNRQKSALGQYFTPRHIVRTMVELADPQYRERIYDPFCGTGGMLIQAFKHIDSNTPEQTTAADKKKRAEILKQETIYGRDAASIVQAAKMNMILAGDGHSNIHRGNSLDHDVEGRYSVVVTNIPFSERREEIACFRHCMSAVRGKRRGRICVIVPERFLDSEHQDYIDLRAELLHEWTLHRVVSLPREVFRGITSAKTSIIFAEWGDGYGREKPVLRAKEVALPYFRVEKDGFTLDKRRDPLLGENDLDRLLEDRYEGNLCTNHTAQGDLWLMKPKEKEGVTSFFPLHPLRDLVDVQDRPVQIQPSMLCREPGMNSKTHTISLREEKQGYNVRVTRRKRILPGDLVFSRLHTQDGLFAFSDAEYHSTGTHLICTVRETEIDRDFLFLVLDWVVPTLSMVDTTGRENYKEADILDLKIPCPPLAKQKAMIKDILHAQATLARAHEALQKAQKHFVLHIQTGSAKTP